MILAISGHNLPLHFRQQRPESPPNVLILLDPGLRTSGDTVEDELEHRIGDKRVIRLIVKWLNAGVMEDGQWQDNLRGTPQGSVISPILANIYLHYVLDLWFQKRWRTRAVDGETIIVRYADDFVVGFQHKGDARRFVDALAERLGCFGLTVHPDKTRLIEFGRFAQANRRARGQGRPETFDFLGFTHYCARNRGGGFQLGRKPVAKRVSRTLSVSGCAKARINGEQQIPHPAICGAGDDSERWVGI